MTFADPTNISGVGGLAIHANSLTGGVLANAAVVSIMTITFFFVKIKGYDLATCFMVSSFVGMTLGALLWATGFVKGQIIVVLLAMLGLSVIFALARKEPY